MISMIFEFESTVGSDFAPHPVAPQRGIHRVKGLLWPYLIWCLISQAGKQARQGDCRGIEFIVKLQIPATGQLPYATAACIWEEIPLYPSASQMPPAPMA